MTLVRPSTASRAGTGAASLLALGLSCLTLSAEGVKTPSPRRREVFEVLTRTSWCDAAKAGERDTFFSEFTDWELRSDGTYTWRLVTDYTPPPGGSGQWTLEWAQGTWMVMLSTGERYPVALNAEGTLNLALRQYRPCRPLEVGRRYSPGSLPPVRLDERVIGVLERVVDADWRRANDLDLNFQPTSVRWKRDWSYVSVYRNGECRNSGTWYATSGEVRGYAATNPCDGRDPKYAEHLVGEPSADGALVLGGDLYVRPGGDSRRATTLLSKFGTFDVRMEYPMPIRHGRATTFTVHVHNRAAQPLKLRRFSVTPEYVRDYRGVQDGVTPAASELAGKGLDVEVAAGGGRARASLDVTFERPMKGWVYFNLLIDGVSQPWDIRVARFVSVRE